MQQLGRDDAKVSAFRHVVLEFVLIIEAARDPRAIPWLNAGSSTCPSSVTSQRPSTKPSSLPDHFYVRVKSEVDRRSQRERQRVVAARRSAGIEDVLKVGLEREKRRDLELVEKFDRCLI